MDCDRAIEMIERSMDERLDADGQRVFDAHLLACASCVRALRDHVRAREALRAGLPRSPVDEELSTPTVQRLLAAMRAARGEPRSGDVRSA